MLADIGKLNIPYQGTTLCFPREAAAGSADVILRILKGMVDAILLIHDPTARVDVTEILRKAFRFPRAEDADASYRVLRLMAMVEITPDATAWKIVHRIVTKISPKVAQVDLNQLIDPSFVRNLEESGFLPDARKKLK